MSYCRFIEGDVYMYASVHGGIECCACSLAGKIKTIFSPGAELDEDDPRREWIGDGCTCDDQCGECTMHDNTGFQTYEEAIAHLEEHVAAGHNVPDRAFKGLRKDMEEGYPLEGTYCKCGAVAVVFEIGTDNPPLCVGCGLKEKNNG